MKINLIAPNPYAIFICISSSGTQKEKFIRIFALFRATPVYEKKKKNYLFFIVSEVYNASSVDGLKLL